jgi:hypothetical protein
VLPFSWDTINVAREGVDLWRLSFYTCATADILKPQQCQELSGKRYTSRWRLMISAYSGIRARLCNSFKLLEETNISLSASSINETTLIKWYKDTTISSAYLVTSAPSNHCSSTRSTCCPIGATSL